MINLDDLLRRGYFPRELPPPFHTSGFADAIAIAFHDLPKAFADPKATWATPHNLARAGALRRPLGIPNPIAHFNLCREVESHWKLIERSIGLSIISGVTPAPPGTAGRAVISSHLKEGFAAIRARTRSSSRFLLKTDISRFYPSVYTHAIPWALHGKSKAKLDRSLSLPGNMIDKLVRKSQGDQSVGLLIGPDTSYVISEAIMGVVDDIFMTKRPSARGFRHVDDYEMCFDTRSEADQALADLQEALTEFELAINAAKTSIVELPLPIEEPWVSELRMFKFRTGTRAQATDLVAYLDRAFVFRNLQPSKPILNYAVARLRGESIQPDNWKLLENLLFQCILVEPHTITVALEMLLHYYEVMSYPMDREALTGVMNKQIVHHAPLGHGSEVAWALWSLIKFNCPVSAESAKILTIFYDSVTALLTLDARERGLVSAKALDTVGWIELMQQDELYGRYWLLVYEANIKGWLPSHKGRDHVESEERFFFLKKNGVSFYDRDRSIISEKMAKSGIEMSL